MLVEMELGANVEFYGACVAGKHQDIKLVIHIMCDLRSQCATCYHVWKSYFQMLTFDEVSRFH